MNQLCKVCGEPAAGFHFGAFTCEGCKSFFGRTYNNISAIAGCKNNGDCVINKKNRTACKACRLRKCLLVGMSKSGSRYGRRSNWFKIHCLLQEQQSQHQQQHGSAVGQNHHPHHQQHGTIAGSNLDQLKNHFHQQHQQARQTYQDKMNPSIKTASMSPTMTTTTTTTTTQLQPPPTIFHQNHHRRLAHGFLPASNKFLNGSTSITQTKSEPRLSSSSPSDSGASSAGDPADDCVSITTSQGGKPCAQLSSSPIRASDCGGGNESNALEDSDDYDYAANRGKHFLTILRSSSAPLNNKFPPPSIGASSFKCSPFAGAFAVTNLTPPIIGTPLTPPPPPPPPLLALTAANTSVSVQEEPIDLSVKSRNRCRTTSPSVSVMSTPLRNSLDVAPKPAPLDLTLVRSQPMSG